TPCRTTACDVRKPKRSDGSRRLSPRITRNAEHNIVGERLQNEGDKTATCDGYCRRVHSRHWRIKPDAKPALPQCESEWSRNGLARCRRPDFPRIRQVHGNIVVA